MDRKNSFINSRWGRRFAAGQLALDCIRFGISLVSRLKMNAALFDFPAERGPGQRGRAARKGVGLKNFKQMLSLDGLPWKEMEVVGYGRKKRRARVLSNTCMWGADGVTPILCSLGQALASYFICSLPKRGVSFP